MTCNFLTPSLPKSEVTDSPLQIKLINFLGLKQYLMDTFIFKRRESKYSIWREAEVGIYLPQKYQAPQNYTLQVRILEWGVHSIPVVRITPKFQKKKDYNTIIYSHGNSSDLSDSLRFVDRMLKVITAEYIIYDYSGYGQSRGTKLGEQIICKDLQIVLSFARRPFNKIILWGFSLGSYPCVYNASKYPVKGLILQCPIGSISCMFEQNLNVQTKFKEDYFANINIIDKVKTKVFITHSSHDQIIPISHVKLLYQKFIKKNSPSNICFVEVSKVKHNSLHKYLSSSHPNDLQAQLLKFIQELQQKEEQQSEQLNNLYNNFGYSVIQNKPFDQMEYQIVTMEDGTSSSKGSVVPVGCFWAKK